MRKILMLPLKYLLLGIACTALLVLFILLHEWIQHYPPSGDGAYPLAVFLPYAVRQSLFPGISAALIFSVAGGRKSSFNPVSFVLVFITTLAMLFFGYAGTSALEPAAPSGFNPLASGSIHILKSGALYIGENPGKAAVWKGETDERLLYSEKYLTEEDESGTVSVLLTGNFPVEINPANPYYSPLTKTGNPLSSYLEDLAFSSGSIISAAEKAADGKGFFSADATDYIIITAVFSLFLAGCSVIISLTGWPALNILVLLGFHRLSFFVFRLFSSEAGFIAETFFGGEQRPLFPLLSILAMTMIVMISGFLFSASGKTGDE